jgi:hypothetical protein
MGLELDRIEGEWLRLDELLEIGRIRVIEWLEVNKLLYDASFFCCVFLNKNEIIYLKLNLISI